MTGLLSLTTFSPLIGVALIMALRLTGKGSDATFKWIALGTTIVTLALAVAVVAGFDPHASGFQMVEDHAWFAGINDR